MDDVKPKWWQVFAAGVTVTLLGLCAIGVGTVGLGAADQLASVGSFALTGVGTLVTVASLVQAVRHQRQRPLVVEPAEPPPPAPSSGVAPLAADLARLRDVTNVDHERLFGVDEAIDRLGESLRNPGGASIISIFGGAGVGKTALAYELIRRHAEEAGFPPRRERFGEVQPHRPGRPSGA
ncbi:hypothetical protein ACIA59_04645 [Micromonospora haikouensis]|uniref:hypothetical protein n=1 Tax=Micromonospora haikouensis TaxID=686309 RepID=UPI00378D34F0